MPDARANAHSLMGAIGNTPLVQLRRLVPADSAGVFAKLEFMNPSGSVKDRLVQAVLDDAEARKALKPGGLVVEATSGNTGIALAMAGAARGYAVLIVMPADVPEETRSRVQALGAETATSPPSQGMDGATAMAQRLAAERGGFWVNQFDNPAGVRAHEVGTGAEVLAQMGGHSIDAFIAGVGTGATLMGVGKALRRRYPGLALVAVEPARAPVISQGAGAALGHRIAGIGPSFFPPLVQREAISRTMGVADEDALAMAATLAKREGLLVGPSSGANVAAALEVARELGQGKTVITVLPDGGGRYLRK